MDRKLRNICRWGSIRDFTPLTPQPMHIIRPIYEIPATFDPFIAEMAREYRGLYGVQAAEHYESGITASLDYMLRQPGSVGYGAFADRSMVGIALGSRRDAQARIDLVHCREGFVGQGIEQELVHQAVDALALGGPDWVSAEFVPLCNLDIEGTMLGLGFRSTRRALMARVLKPAADVPTSQVTEQGDPTDPAIARLIFDAFGGLAAYSAVPDFSSLESTVRLLRDYASNDYGVHRPDWCRVVRGDKGVLGVILGTAQTMDTGFVFQVAVAPEAEGRGIGRALMRDLERAFAEVGMRRVMLGVTVETPAFDWYQRQGYQVVRPVNAYHRSSHWISKTP